MSYIQDKTQTQARISAIGRLIRATVISIVDYPSGQSCIRACSDDEALTKYRVDQFNLLGGTDVVLELVSKAELQPIVSK